MRNFESSRNCDLYFSFLRNLISSIGLFFLTPTTHNRTHRINIMPPSIEKENPNVERKRKIENEESEIVDATEANDLEIIAVDISVSASWISAFRTLDELSRRVEQLEVIQQNQIHKTALIRKGRLFYWDKYGKEYLEKFSDDIFVASYKTYDQGGCVINSISYPTTWSHFIHTIVKDRETKVGFLDLLMGGDTYDDLSTAVPDIDAKTAANMVMNVKVKKYSDLFEVVFGDLASNFQD